MNTMNWMRALVMVLAIGAWGGCTDDPHVPAPVDAGCGAACDDGGQSDASDVGDGGLIGGGGDTQQPDDAGEDVTQGQQDAEEDATQGQPDAEEDATQGQPDVEEGDVDSGDDAGGDVGGDPHEGRPLGQCNSSTNCPPDAPGGPLCTRSAPGGICSGCGEFAGCAAGYECFAGSCVADCSADSDCPPGMACSSRGQCAIQRCVEDVCPDPMFGCNASDMCERRSCEEQVDCPARTTCQGGVCIEDRQLVL
ncbi:hypothetical protein DL240_08235 [Lujinxingia litoralis]|uniref:Tryptophan synthase alpha chain n=1 Tax=Lujinxingia litoralis TaxID=2211119 RepID=A0A328C5L4_9DELT|nr:hypothetical protein [Lujinxingia litoralis]RAL22871.1 hypothetical protein DL240_08235 [Lujinxingia litoralis]